MVGAKGVSPPQTVLWPRPVCIPPGVAHTHPQCLSPPSHAQLPPIQPPVRRSLQILPPPEPLSEPSLAQLSTWHLPL